MLQISRPARYAGSEYGCAGLPRNNPRIRLALAFPDVYEIGCSNLGLTILYRIASSYPWVHVERVFAPWKDYARQLRERREHLLSFESAAPLKSFDIIGFSLQHELLYTNALLMLDLAGIPLRSGERRESDPIIIAGGPSASNPEPLSEFIDAFALGDGENLLPAILTKAAQGKEKGKSRHAVLEDLTGIEGLYIPAFYKREDRCGPRRSITGVKQETGAPPIVKYSILRTFDKTGIYDPPIAAIEPVFDRYQIEITRGCCGGCRFCHAGSVYRPARHRPPEQILKYAVEGVLRTGYGAVSLSSLSPADYPQLEPLVLGMEDFIRRLKILLSVSSLRSYGVSEKVLRTIASVKATGITLAPEAGTRRLRNILGKQVTDEDLMKSIELLQRLGWQRVKLYFMIGLPGEDQADLEGIVETIGKCLRPAQGKRRLDISVSISNFVPKPFTAFQWERMAGPGELETKRKTIRTLARGLRVKLNFHNVHQSIIESILARGGSELSGVIEYAYRLGCDMDGWTEHFDYDRWSEALDKNGLSIEDYLRKIPEESNLPWGHIRSPVSQKFLHKELEKSRKGESSRPCPAHRGSGTCLGCGAECDQPPSLVDETALQAVSTWAATKMKEVEKERDRCFGKHLDGGERLQLAVKFKRFGRMIYTGHQDMIRVLRHILMRANIPMKYSSGFTPRPIMSFRCALPLGVIGVNEESFVEVEREPVDLDMILENLRGSTHPGVEFFDISVKDRKDVVRMIKTLPEIHWFVVLTEGAADHSLASAAEDINRRSSIPMIRKRHKRAQSPSGTGNDAIDLKQMIRTAQPFSESDLKDMPDFSGEWKVIRFDTRPAGNHIIRMEEIDSLLEPYGLTPRWHIRKLMGSRIQDADNQ